MDLPNRERESATLYIALYWDDGARGPMSRGCDDHESLDARMNNLNI